MDAVLATVDERNISRPINWGQGEKRANAELPCASTGICTECDHPRRVCNYTGILAVRCRA